MSDGEPHLWVRPSHGDDSFNAEGLEAASVELALMLGHTLEAVTTPMRAAPNTRAMTRRIITAYLSTAPQSLEGRTFTREEIDAALKRLESEHAYGFPEFWDYLDAAAAALGGQPDE